MEPVLALPGSHALWEPLTPVWLESSLWEIEPYLVTDPGKQEMRMFLQCGTGSHGEPGQE